MFRSLLVLSLVSLAAAQGGQAQQDTTGLVPGRRIRVHQQGNQKLVGSFVSMDSASLAMVTNTGDTVQVPRGNIAALDLSQGTKSNFGKRTLTGLLIGAGAGLAFGLATCNDSDGWGCSVGYDVLGLAVIGTGIGALAGIGSRSDKWAPIAWPTLSIRSGGRDGKTVALGMHLRF